MGFNRQRLGGVKEIAKFIPDMTGGVSSVNVYAPDLIEPVMIGDVTVPLLRIVNIHAGLNNFPIDVTLDNAAKVREAVKEKFIPTKRTSQVYKVRDYVRIERYKHAFPKGYEPNFTSEVFCIS